MWEAATHGTLPLFSTTGRRTRWHKCSAQALPLRSMTATHSSAAGRETQAGGGRFCHEDEELLSCQAQSLQLWFPWTSCQRPCDDHCCCPHCHPRQRYWSHAAPDRDQACWDPGARSKGIRPLAARFAALLRAIRSLWCWLYRRGRHCAVR